MDDSWHYIDLVCPVCGGKVRQYFDHNICECCHYTLPSSDSMLYSNKTVLYNINSSGTGAASGKIDLNTLSPHTLIIDKYELIKMHHKELDIEFEFNTKKLENIDIIEINGHRFVRDKK